MLKRPIKYTDFDGNVVTEDFYFNITKAEMLEREMSTDGGFAVVLQEAIKNTDVQVLFREFKEFILWSYGERSADGKRFMKTPELRDNFEHTAAYDALFMELCTNADAAASFIENIMPANMVDEIRAQIEAGKPSVSNVFTPPPAPTDPAFAAMQAVAIETPGLPTLPPEGRPSTSFPAP